MGGGELGLWNGMMNELPHVNPQPRDPHPPVAYATASDAIGEHVRQIRALICDEALTCRELSDVEGELRTLAHLCREIPRHELKEAMKERKQ